MLGDCSLSVSVNKSVAAAQLSCWSGGEPLCFSLLRFHVFKVPPSRKSKSRSDVFHVAWTVLFEATHDTRSSQPWSIAAASHSRRECGITLLCQTESSLRSHRSLKLLFFRLYWGTRVVGFVGGGSSLPYLNWSSMALTETGTSVNRRHSKGIKKALHWFVLEAVLLICLPTNECIGPVFPARVDNGTPSLY